MIFILKQYDFELLTFELCQDGLDGFACSILNVNEANRKLLPIGMPLNGDGYKTCFLSRRFKFKRSYNSPFLPLTRSYKVLQST